MKARGSFEKNGVTLYFNAHDACQAAKARASQDKHLLGPFRSQANQPNGQKATCTRCKEECWVQYGRQGDYWEVLAGNCQSPCSGGKK